MGTAQPKQAGTCQVCGKRFMVRAGAVVSHGFERPGCGYTEGGCEGEGFPPYESSCALIRQMFGRTKTALAAHRAELARVEAGRVTTITQVTRPVWKGDPPVETVYVAAETPHAVWRVVCGVRAAELRRLVDHGVHAVDRLGRLIATWKPRQLVQEVDHQRRTPQEQAAATTRRAVLETKRVAKAAARASLKAQQAAKDAERLALLTAAGAKVRAAAHSDKPLEQAREDALTVLCELGQFRMRGLLGWYWEEDLHADAAMVRLGLAELCEERARGIRYRTWFWK